VHVLFVSATDVRRSPVAERLAVMWAREHLGPGAGGLSIEKAGVEAIDGQEMDPHSAEALARLGGDPAGVRARGLTADLAARADLVLTMSRSQRARVLELAPRGLRHTFTLLEAAGLLEDADLSGLDRLSPPQRVGELAVRLHHARAHHRDTQQDDIEDPAGRRSTVHHRVARTIAGAVFPLVRVLCNDDLPMQQAIDPDRA
jgi:protein-tyrosine phosphatase